MTIKITLFVLVILSSFMIIDGSASIFAIPLMPNTGGVCIHSNPSGAYIKIDDNPQSGKSTALSKSGCWEKNIISNITAESHNFELSLTGYQNENGSLDIRVGQVLDYDIGDLIAIQTNEPNISPTSTIPKIVKTYYINVAMPQQEENHSTTYRSFVTDGLGFYKIRNIEVPPVSFTYEDRILNIRQGDTIIWENDADAAIITIVSDQSLWSDNVGKIRVGGKINYKFDDPGTYTFYVKDTSMKQTIVVTSMGHEPVTEPKNTYTPSPTVTKYMSTPTPTNTQNTRSKTSTPTPVSTFPQIAYTPTTSDTNNNVSTQASIPINLPIRITATTIASVIIVMFSLYMTRKTGKK